MRISVYRILAFLLLAAAFCSCRSAQGIGPANPEEEPGRELWREDESSASSLSALVKDEELLSLISEARKNNCDLLSRSFNLQAESYQLKQNLASLLPDLSFELAAGRNNLEIDETTGVYEFKKETVNSFRGGFNLGWELDIWGRGVDGQRVLGHELKQNEIALEQEKRSLAVGIIQIWIEQAAQQMSLRVEEKRIELLDRTGLIIEERFRSGIASVDDLSYTNSKRAIAEANLLHRKTRLHQLQTRMDLLLKQDLSGRLPVPEELPEIVCPILASEDEFLPGRTDVRQALEALEAARLGRRDAIKGFLPRLSLGAQIYKESEKVDKVESSDRNWLVQGTLSVPLFAGGRRYHLLREKDARRNAALSDLKSCRSRARSEIELGLRNETEYLKLLEALTRAHDESEKILGVAERRYLNGITGIENYLNAQDDLLSYKLRIIEMRASLYINRINLALSLGLGWDRGVENEL